MWPQYRWGRWAFGGTGQQMDRQCKLWSALRMIRISFRTGQSLRASCLSLSDLDYDEDSLQAEKYSLSQAHPRSMLPRQLYRSLTCNGIYRVDWPDLKRVEEAHTDPGMQHLAKLRSLTQAYSLQGKCLLWFWIAELGLKLMRSLRDQSSPSNDRHLVVGMRTEQSKVRLLVIAL